jgi:hypothetical protein
MLGEKVQQTRSTLESLRALAGIELQVVRHVRILLPFHRVLQAAKRKKGYDVMLTVATSFG